VRLPIGAAIAGARAGKGSANDLLREITKRRPSMVEEYFSPGKYTVYIISDVDADAFKPEELQALADMVKNGSGLMMLGGNSSFGAGGYAGTPLESVLPVLIQDVDRQKLGDEPRIDLYIDTPLRALPTEQSKNESMLRLADDPLENDKQWRLLPELEKIRRIKPKQAAREILTAGFQPILVQGTFGSGRVLAFAGNTTWFWWFDHEKEHKRFWRQLILWLAKMDDSMQGDCWIELERPRFGAGETVKFKVRLRTEKGEEVTNPKVEATVRYPDGEEETVSIINENGTATGSIRNTSRPGDYSIRATASPSGASALNIGLHEASSRFLVFEQDMEMDNPVADPTLLANIAGITGASAVVAETLPNLLQELEKKSELLTEKRETKLTLYDSWFALILVILLFSIEWFLRKLWGMV
ncbi:MAG: hypothetical protein ACRC2T_16025, partial [Thermoguttaceae bacterium]